MRTTFGQTFPPAKHSLTESPTPSSDYKKFSEVLSKAEHIIVLAGAGLSAASGIPTFRGAGASGLW